jgi:hypothetical protein
MLIGGSKKQARVEPYALIGSQNPLDSKFQHPTANNHSNIIMTLRLLEDILMDEDLERELSFRDFILDDSTDPVQSSCTQGIKRERSQSIIVQCVTEDSEDGINDDEHKELNEFLRGIGFLETPRSSLVVLSDKDAIDDINPFPIGRWATERMVPPPEKCRRVALTTPHQVKSNNVTAPDNQVTRGKRLNKKTSRTVRKHVPFEEMQRLMIRYGPIKTSRKSKSLPDQCGTAGNAKADSIRRKFYRWFPDFEERFVKNSDGLTFRPKAGHAEEVRYREAMRSKDKKALVYKRKIGRKY